jgi:histidine triad (HIT) family protein
MTRYCVFCEIVAGREPAAVLYDSEQVLVFRNHLRWLPVQLLVIPKRHLIQSELWSGEEMPEVARVAEAIGREHCPGGFRLVSNFGWDGMQSQEHAHVHVLGGRFLGHYIDL